MKSEGSHKKKKHKRVSLEQVVVFYQVMLHTAAARPKNQPFAAADVVEYILAMDEMTRKKKK